MTTPTSPDLDQLLHDGAVRLERTGGVPTWEAFPGSRHQRMIDTIRASIEPVSVAESSGNWTHLSNVSIRFQDGSLKEPDIAIFTTPLPITDEALPKIPEAVVEVISPGYEYKDIFLNPRFYLAQDVLDVVIVDPRSGAVTHYRTTGVSSHQAPVTLDLQCGCRCTIPAIQ